MGLPPEIGAIRVQQRALLPELLKIAAQEVPDRGVPGSDAQQVIANAADHERRVRLLHGLWLAIGVVDLVVVTGKARRGFGPHPHDQLARLTQSSYPFARRVEGDTIGMVFGCVVALT